MKSNYNHMEILIGLAFAGFVLIPVVRSTFFWLMEQWEVILK